MTDSEDNSRIILLEFQEKQQARQAVNLGGCWEEEEG